jgi:hypothetical protein
VLAPPCAPAAGPRRGRSVSHSRPCIPYYQIRAAVAVTIDRQSTALHLHRTSQYDTPELISTLPPRTLVTAFPDWYGNERVVARVVEKEEAAATREHIAVPMRDPVLRLQ